MSQRLARRCRPYLFVNYARFQRGSSRRSFFPGSAWHANDGGDRHVTNDYKRRVAQLEEAHGTLEECYPLLAQSQRARVTVEDFRSRFNGHLKPGETQHDEQVLVAGRIQAVRTAGNKLLFLDLKQEGHTVQVLCQLRELNANASTELPEFKAFAKLVRKGDWYEANGLPHRSPNGELSVLARSLPVLLAPSLHQIPDTLDDAETRSTNRPVDMLVNAEAVQTLRVRHLVERHLNDFFGQRGFTKVSTPILSSGAGGAIARPFETEATELERQTLNLRIAPELWLKRLVVGGMEKVYEIGPAFRNEGVDATHNPEFYTCEFYEALATLDDLMATTEQLLASMSQSIDRERDARLSALPLPGVSFETPFPRLQFITTIERESGRTLPDLADPDAAHRELTQLFKDQDIPLPSNPTLPRLLDALGAHYIEPICQAPTFITHHPAVLSPLSKHTICPQTNQLISLRAELFIQGREYANMYEEENSPFAQRRKFQEQLAFREIDGESDGKGGLDENYLETLEWGLPPTGGWGCGIDRLVMLFAGRERISDVLPFGTLRNVVALGRGR